MSNYTRTFSTDCPAALLEAINADANITSSLVQIVSLAGGTAIFEFDGELTSNEVTQLDGILSGWTCPPPVNDIDGMLVVDGDPAETTPNTLWSSSRVVEFTTAEITAVSAGDPNNLTGKTFGATFVHNSGAKNVWLRHESHDGGLSSDKVPFVIPWDCNLVAVTYSNREYTSRVDVEVWATPLGQNPETNCTKKCTLEIRNHRTAVATDLGGTIAFNRGDTVAVYVADRGEEADHPVVHLTMLITDNTIGNVSDNFRDDFDRD
jgi:hypothetical protein